MNKNNLLAKLQIEHPIVQAPMGGGPTTPELVAAVSNAGGLGSIAAAYLQPAQIVEEIRRVRGLTSKPFSVNLFAGGYQSDATYDAQPMLQILAEIHAELGLPVPASPATPSDPFPAQFEAMLEAHPPVFSFTFGIPAKTYMDRLRQHGIFAMGTATTAEEARQLECAGVDAIIAQGAEAGAHRGTFLGAFDDAMIPVRQLVQEITAVSSLPVIASGGIMDGSNIAEAMSWGAAAVQMGTAFLCCTEAGTSATYKNAILNAKKDMTTVTRAFSGRPARGLINTFITTFKDRQEAILPYPVQNALTRAMRTAAGKQGKAEYLSLWAGTGVTRARALPATELMAQLIKELAEAAARGKSGE